MLLRHTGFRNLCRARDLLLEVPDEPLSIVHIARMAHISPFHFIRQFKAVFGLTPHQFRIQSRLDRAKRLLAKGELSVTDVCMAVGFSSLGASVTSSDVGSEKAPPPIGGASAPSSRFRARCPRRWSRDA